VSFVLGAGKDAARVRYGVAHGRLSVERPSDAFADPGFSGTQGLKMPLKNGRISMRIFIDRSGIEVFAQDGPAAISDQAFLPHGDGGLVFFVEGGEARLIDLQTWPLRSIWR
jgi:sucrose-6-phosphate hydrolase SacC (GH32 family)